MQRTTSASVPTVYRSLPVMVSSSVVGEQGNEISRKVEPRAKNGSIEGASTSEPLAFPYPPVPVQCLSNGNGVIWKDHVDLEAVKKRLSSVCTSAKLVQTKSTCQFVCTADAPDGNERVNFLFNIWAVPEGEEGAFGRYLVVLERCSGCPYFFNQLIAAAFSVLLPECKKGKMFRVPKLPECMSDAGDGIRLPCVEAAISMATSDVCEQRFQGLGTLSQLCSEKNDTFLALFRTAQGPARISKLTNDPDAFVQKTVINILARCA
jgi:hypothetical protein